MYEMHDFCSKCEIIGDLLHFLHVVTYSNRVAAEWMNDSPKFRVLGVASFMTLRRELSNR